MRLSVIIPTHDRPASLAACLATLQGQDADAGAFEVVVVDDGSQSDIAAVVAEAAAAGPVAMRCERQPLGGLNRARNRGVATAVGELIAFLDDDTLVSPGWAGGMLAAFAEPACAGVGGRVTLRLDGPEPRWLAEYRYYLAEYDLGPQERWLDGDPWEGGDPMPVGANCAVRRSAYDRVGAFDPGLDRIGGSLVSNGDTAFFRRLRAAGERLRYAPAAHVVHCVPAGRLTTAFFTRRHYAQGISDELLMALEGATPGWGRRYRHAREVGHAAKVLAGDLPRRRGSVHARFWASYWAGRLVAVGRRAPSAGP